MYILLLSFCWTVHASIETQSYPCINWSSCWFIWWSTNLHEGKANSRDVYAWGVRMHIDYMWMYLLSSFDTSFTFYHWPFAICLEGCVFQLFYCTCFKSCYLDLLNIEFQTASSFTTIKDRYIPSLTTNPLVIWIFNSPVQFLFIYTEEQNLFCCWITLARNLSCSSLAINFILTTQVLIHL